MIIPHAPWLDTSSHLNALIRRNLPGVHLVVFGTASTGIEARRQGFQVRDTFLIQSPGQTRLAFLLRKPLEESTLVAQVLKTGTGAINIDGCRVGTGSVDDYGRSAANAKGTKNAHPGFEGKSFANAERDGAYAHESGRWPPNLLFVHGPLCVKQAPIKVRGHKGYPNGPGGKSYQYSSDKRGSEVRPAAWEGHADADGNETIDKWDCQEGCPVSELDGQSGVLKSGTMKKGMVRSASNRAAYSNHGTHILDQERVSSEGGASRFFPQFANDQELLAWLIRLVGPHGSVLPRLYPTSELDVASESSTSA